jgi:hypothetical protein
MPASRHHLLPEETALHQARLETVRFEQVRTQLRGAAPPAVGFPGGGDSTGVALAPAHAPEAPTAGHRCRDGHRGGSAVPQSELPVLVEAPALSAAVGGQGAGVVPAGDDEGVWLSPGHRGGLQEVRVLRAGPDLPDAVRPPAPGLPGRQDTTGVEIPRGDPLEDQGALRGWATGWGVDLVTSVPSPNCPSDPCPQHMAVPSVVTPQLWKPRPPGAGRRFHSPHGMGWRAGPRTTRKRPRLGPSNGRSRPRRARRCARSPPRSG